MYTKTGFLLQELGFPLIEGCCETALSKGEATRVALPVAPWTRFALLFGQPRPPLY
jgi:hypothetical protein